MFFGHYRIYDDSVFNLYGFLFDAYCIHFARMDYDFGYGDCVSLRTFYSNENENNVALYRAFHF